MAFSRISPGTISASQADTLNRLLAWADARMRDESARAFGPSPEEFVPVKVTGFASDSGSGSGSGSGSSGEDIWYLADEHFYDSNGRPADLANARTGILGRERNGYRVAESSFPFYALFRRELESAASGVLYEFDFVRGISPTRLRREVLKRCVIRCGSGSGGGSSDCIPVGVCSLPTTITATFGGGGSVDLVWTGAYWGATVDGVTITMAPAGSHINWIITSESGTTSGTFAPDCGSGTAMMGDDVTLTWDAESCAGGGDCSDAVTREVEVVQYWDPVTNQDVGRPVCEGVEDCTDDFCDASGSDAVTECESCIVPTATTVDTTGVVLPDDLFTVESPSEECKAKFSRVWTMPITSCSWYEPIFIDSCHFDSLTQSVAARMVYVPLETSPGVWTLTYTLTFEMGNFAIATYILALEGVSSCDFPFPVTLPLSFQHAGCNFPATITVNPV